MSKLKDVLMKRDGLSERKADLRIRRAIKKLGRMVAAGKDPYDFCEKEFGLEPDYLDDLGIY